MAVRIKIIVIPPGFVRGCQRFVGSSRPSLQDKDNVDAV
jgi:hypothetical protein